MHKLKDSCTRYLGFVPESWKIEKIKFHLKRTTEKNHPDAEVLSLYREYGILPKSSRDDNHNVTSEDTSKYLFVRKGNFVINKMKAWQGSMAVSEYDGIVSPAYFVYEFTDDVFNKKYFHYLLRNKAYVPEFRRLSGGIRDGQWDLPDEAFKNMLVVIPSLEEQEHIVNYLDQICPSIEKNIEDLKKQIEELEKYRDSVTYETVTHGIRKDRNFKSTNIKWIRTIPAEWNTNKIKYLLVDRNEKNYPIKTTDILSLTAKQGVVPLSEKEGGGNKPKEDVSKYKLAYPGDIVMNCMNVLSGSVALSKYYGCVSPVYYMLKPKNANDDVRYFNYIFQTFAFQRSLFGLGNGILIKESSNGKLNTIRMRISLETLGRLYLPVPSPEEQKEISDFLDKLYLEVEQVIKDKTKQIESLDLYKKSIIYEYVTGKKEVPNE